MTAVPHFSRSPSILDSLLGWALLLTTANVLYLALLIPETPMGSNGRELIDRLHMSWGLISLFLVAARLFLWHKNPPQLIPEALVSTGICRDISFTFYISVAAEAVVGPIRAWGEGYTVPFFNLGSLPALVPQLYEIRVVAGYFHSGISFFILAILAVGLTASIILGLRSKAPFYRLFPC